MQMHLFRMVKLPSVLLPTLHVNIYKEIQEVADVNNILKALKLFCLPVYGILNILHYSLLFYIKDNMILTQMFEAYTGKYQTEYLNLVKIKAVKSFDFFDSEGFSRLQGNHTLSEE